MLHLQKAVRYFQEKSIFFIIFILLTTLSFCRPGFAAPQKLDIVISKKVPHYKYTSEKIQKSLLSQNKNIAIRVFNMEGNIKTAKVILEKIKKSPPDLILSIGTGSTIFLSENIDDIPIIFTMVYKMDKIDDAIEGKKNVAGVFLNLEMDAPFSILKKISPEMDTVGVIYSSSYLENQLNELKPDFKKYGITLIKKEIKKQTDIPKTVDELLPNIDALYLLPDPLLMKKEILKKIMLKTFANKVFVFGESKAFVQMGALIGFGFEINSVTALTKNMIVDYFEKRDFESLQSRKNSQFDYYLNIRTAKNLGIKIPDDILKKSKKVVD